MIYSFVHELKVEKWGVLACIFSGNMSETHFPSTIAALHTSGGAEERTPP